MRNIVLVGFMATGKTTVGRLIAHKAGMGFISIDELIEKKEGMPIKDIFSLKGEGYFRKAERAAVAEASKARASVIDAGGGVVIDELNVRDLKAGGIIFCLDATPEEILERAKGLTHRPLLNVSDPLSEIIKIMEARAEYYERADYHIDTGGRSAPEVAEAIIEIYVKSNG